MTEQEKARRGFLYDANYDPTLLQLREDCAQLCYALNMTPPRDREGRQAILRQLLEQFPDSAAIMPPFYCDYGKNISLGENFYANHNCVILDAASVTIGDFVFVGPNCVISTSGHPIDAGQRDAGLEIALPISIGSHVWIGANVSILPGVTIGSGTVIGAGSVVNRDIPSGVVAAGNPCRVIRAVTPEDRQKYPLWDDDLPKAP